MVVGAFSLTAVATGHEHWLKDKVDVVGITGPLNAWIEQLPVKTLKKLEQNLAPALLLVGAATVIGPDLLLEIKLRDESRRIALGRGPQTPYYAANSPSGGTGGGANGNQPRPETRGDWREGIPAGHNLGDTLDF